MTGEINEDKPWQSIIVVDGINNDDKNNLLSKAGDYSKAKSSNKNGVLGPNEARRRTLRHWRIHRLRNRAY